MRGFPGWAIPNEDFEATATSFSNPDWAEIVLHSYRARWGLAPLDPAYEKVEQRIAGNPTIAVPTLVVHGGADPCNDPSTSEGKEKFFTSGYTRLVRDGVGHFPQREAAIQVGAASTKFLTEK